MSSERAGVPAAKREWGSGSGSSGADRRAELRRREGALPSLLTVCAWCEQVRVGRHWLAMEEAVRRLRTFDWPEPPALTHGICTDCLERLLARQRALVAAAGAEAAAAPGTR